MKQQLLILVVTSFFCLTTTQGQESLDYIIVENYDSFTSSYSLDTKEDYTYNTEGQLTKSEHYYWESNAWLLSLKEEYTYNTNGDLTESVFANWNPSTNQWNNIYRNVTTYDNNRIIEQINYNWENGAWTPEDKTEFIYVANTIDTFNSYDWIGGQWVLDERGALTYNSGKILEITTEEYINNIWTPADKTVYVRTASTKKIEEIIYQEWDGTAWKNIDKDTYSVDAQGNRLSEIYSESQDGTTWEPSTKTDYAYDSSKLISNYYNPFYRDSYFYELSIDDFPHYNKVLTSLESEYDDTGWEISNKTTYFYSDGTLSLNDLSNSNFVTLYPNPVKNTLTIKLNTFTESNAMLYDVNGRLILEQKLQNLTTPLNIETLNAGVYVLKINAENGFATKRITKL